MKTAAYFYVVFVLTLLAPHVTGPLRIAWAILYAVALYALLWRGIPRERGPRNRV